MSTNPGITPLSSDRADPPGEGVAGWILRFRRTWLVGSALVLAGAGAGASRLTFNNDTRLFFSESNPQLQALEALEDEYAKNQGVVFVIAPEDGDIFTARTLAVIEKLTEAAWTIPYAARVDSIVNFQHTWADGDNFHVEDLVRDAASLSKEDLNRIRRIAVSEPLLVNRMISAAGHVTAVYVTCRYSESSVEAVPEIAASARRMANALREADSGMAVHLAGVVMSDTAFGEVSRRDMVTLIPAMFVTLTVLIGLSLRSLIGTLATLLVTLMSMATAMGMAGWFRIELTPASVAAPTIILTLAVADCVHLLVAMLRTMRSGQHKSDAIVRSLRDNLWPMFLASVTTAIGFLSMNFSDAPPFRDLGNIVAIGVMAAFFYAILFLPSLLSFVPVRIRPPRHPVARAGMGVFADFVIARRTSVLWVSLAVAALASVGVMRIEFNDDWIKNFSRRYDIRRAADFVQKNLTGLYVIEYSLDAGSPGGINDPGYLATVDRFADWYRGQPKVVHVDAFTEVMKRLNMNMHGDDPDWRRLPDRQDLAAQYLLLYEMSLPFGLDLNNRINVDQSATRFTATVLGMTTSEQRIMDARARTWLQDNARESMVTYGSSLSIIWAHISARNIRSMLGASIGALVLISGILVFALRSVRIGLLSLIPNLAPAFMAFGIWGLTVRQVGLGLSVIVSMTLGIVVDDTVHFLSKYLRARREQGLDSADAVRYAFDHVGTAMWVSTLALVAGFLVLTLSGYKMNAHMGLMSAITIALALAFDVLVLPALLLIVDERAAGAIPVSDDASVR